MGGAGTERALIPDQAAGEVWRPWTAKRALAWRISVTSTAELSRFALGSKSSVSLVKGVTPLCTPTPEQQMPAAGLTDRNGMTGTLGCLDLLHVVLLLLSGQRLTLIVGVFGELTFCAH